MFSEAILSALEKDKELISAYEEKKTAIEQKGFKLQKRMKIANGIRKVGILLVKVVLVAPVIVFLYFCYNLYLNNVNLLSFISILVAFIPWILLIIFEKTINPAAIISKCSTILQSFICGKLKCSNEECEAYNLEKETINKKILDLKMEIQALEVTSSSGISFKQNR